MLGSRVEVIEPHSRVSEVVTSVGGSVPIIDAGQTVRVVAQFVASTDLSGHRIVTLNLAGQLMYADNSAMNQMNRPMFMTENAWSAGDIARVVALGAITDPSFSFIVGRSIFIGTNGLPTQTVPTEGFLRRVAVAAEDSGIWFSPQPPIILSS